MTEPHPDKTVNRAAVVGYPHTKKCNTPHDSNIDTFCTHTNPKALNTPRCKETDS